MQENTLSEAFASLHDLCGSHSKAAKFLGMTKDHYRVLRNHRRTIPEKTAKLILVMAKEAKEKNFSAE